MPDNIDRAQRVAKRLLDKGIRVSREWALFQVKRHASYVDAGGGTDDAKIERLVDCLEAVAKTRG